MKSQPNVSANQPSVLPDALVGRFVRLEPLTLVDLAEAPNDRADQGANDGTNQPGNQLGNGHVGGLIDAAKGDRSTFGLTMVPEPTTESVRAWIEAALGEQQRGTVVAYATRRLLDNKIVGSTRFLNIEKFPVPFGRTDIGESRFPSAVEIGGTWLNAQAQRTYVNTDAKLAMLTHAFETWGVFRVWFKTDERNQRSRDNIERVGAKFEGILRNHMYAADTGLRNSAVYSIVDSEWEVVKERLVAKLQ